MKCKNCGKLKENHYNDEINPITKRYWCYPIGRFSAGDKEYLMKFEEDSHKTSNRNKEKQNVHE